MQISPIKSPFQQSKKPMGLESLLQLLGEVKEIKKEMEATIRENRTVGESLARLSEQVKQIQRGEKGETGPEGPMPDISYVAQTAADMVLAQMPKPVDGKNPDKKEIINELAGLFPSAEEIAMYLPKPKEIDIDALLKQIKKSKFSVEQIDGLEEKMRAYQNQLGRGYLHGGGVPSLTAGANVTLTPKSDGGFIVSSTGGTGTFYVDTVSGTIDGANTAFTVSNTITSALVLFLAGVPYQPTVDFTVSGTDITFISAPDISLAGQPFFLLHT